MPPKHIENPPYITFTPKQVGYMLQFSYRVGILPHPDPVAASPVAASSASQTNDYPLPLRLAGYSTLFLGYSTAEYMKTRKQMGSDASYGESFKRVIAEHGRPLHPPALQMILRLSCRSTMTAISVSTGNDITPEMLAAVETAAFTPVEHYRMYAALNKDTPCFLKWANKMPLSDVYRGTGAVAMRQWTQWSLIYGIRDTLNEHTDLTPDQSNLAAVIASSIATTPIDIVRNIIQHPKNKDLTPKHVVREVISCAKEGTLVLGARARTSATVLNFMLSLHVMETVKTSWKEMVGQDNNSSPGKGH